MIAVYLAVALVAFLVLLAAGFIYLALTAPVGYEDEFGYHNGEPHR